MFFWDLKEQQEGEKKKRVETERGSELVGVDVDANGDEEDGDEAEVDDGVNSDGGSARLHAAKLHHPVSTRDLEQKTGVSNTNSTNATRTGPQSAIFV